MEYRLTERGPRRETVLELLGDGQCLDLLGAASDPKTASELSDACGVPLSTTYRKLDRLSDADLVAIRARVGADGDHARRYVRNVSEVVVRLESERRNRDPRAAAFVTVSGAESADD